MSKLQIEIHNLVQSLGMDYQRMSLSGQETYDELEQLVTKLVSHD